MQIGYGFGIHSIISDFVSVSTGGMMSNVRYPIGPFKTEDIITPEKRKQYVDQLAQTPEKLRGIVGGLSPAQLDTPYRPDGWTIRQVIHHLADSHTNAYIRFKMALTEDTPTVKSYDQALWAELEDSRTASVEDSLSLFEGLYRRWAFLLKSLSAESFARKLNHPDAGIISLDRYLGMCVWHGHHHIAHIQELRQKMNWE
jgi:hypothetical protein